MVPNSRGPPGCDFGRQFRTRYVTVATIAGHMRMGFVSDFYQPRGNARVEAQRTVALQRIATVAQQMRKQRALAEQFLRTSYTSSLSGLETPRCRATTVNHAPVISRQQFVAPAGRTACWLVSQAESLKASSLLWQLSWKTSSVTELLL